jgi:hypothetical protein
MKLRCFAILVASVLVSGGLAAQDAEIPKDWLTPAEASGFESTPSYDETLAFLRKVQARLPEMYLGFYGTSGQGRPMPFVVVSKDHAFTAEKARAAGKPVVMIQNGIHAGEIEGKDASLMILRDLALGRHREILDAMTLVVIPIYNVDGHERVSPFNRPNQNGPKAGMGFRATSNGLDLNRDFIKLDSEEARTLVSLITAWRPHLHVDDHTTDGVDMDWTVTWTFSEAPQTPAPVDAWVRAHLPAAVAATEKDGFRTGPYVDLEDPNDPAKGMSSWVGQPRYSSGYVPLLNRPSILVEMHSYKPYRRRVLGNRSFLLALLHEVARDPAALPRAVAESEAAEVALGRPDAKPSDVALVYEVSPEPDSVRFPVYAGTMRTSVVTGKPLLLFERGRVQEIQVPWLHKSRITKSLPRPRGYLVLPGWPQIEQRLRWHGLRVEKLTAPAELDVEAMRVAHPKFAEQTFQGLTRLTAGVTRTPERRTLPAGTLWVPADQPDFEIAVQLLEPDAVDSLLSWGLLSAVFEQREYIDPRVLEGWATEKLKDGQVAAEWQAALKDEKFAADPTARYQWWYRHTPYFDATVGLMPVFRAMKAPAVRTQPWR